MSDAKRNSRIEFFDALRCLAVVPVMMAHAGSSAMYGGYLGVYLFFAISGYLITLSLETQSVSVFYVRRFFRIYVPLAFVLGAWAALSYGLRPADEIRSLVIENLFALDPNTKTAGYTIGVLWTLHAEIWFYVLAPVLLLPFRHGFASGREVTSAVVIILGIIAFASRTLFEFPRFPLRMFLSFFDCFAVGILAAMWRDRLTLGKGSARLLAFGGLTSYLLFVTFSSSRDWVALLQIATSILCVAMIVGCRSGGSVLSNPIFSSIGRISFSMYLVHGMVIDFRLIVYFRDILSKIEIFQLFGQTASLANSATRFSLYAALVLFLSAAMYATIERLGIWLGRSLSGRHTSALPGHRVSIEFQHANVASRAITSGDVRGDTPSDATAAPRAIT